MTTVMNWGAEMLARAQAVLLQVFAAASTLLRATPEWLVWSVAACIGFLALRSMLSLLEGVSSFSVQ